MQVRVVPEDEENGPKRKFCFEIRCTRMLWLHGGDARQRRSRARATTSAARSGARCGPHTSRVTTAARPSWRAG